MYLCSFPFTSHSPLGPTSKSLSNTLSEYPQWYIQEFPTEGAYPTILGPRLNRFRFVFIVHNGIINNHTYIKLCDVGCIRPYSILVGPQAPHSRQPQSWLSRQMPYLTFYRSFSKIRKSCFFISLLCSSQREYIQLDNRSKTFNTL